MPEEYRPYFIEIASQLGKSPMLTRNTPRVSILLPNRSRPPKALLLPHYSGTGTSPRHSLLKNFQTNAANVLGLGTLPRIALQEAAQARNERNNLVQVEKKID